VHPAAVISESAHLGAGTVVSAGVIVQQDATIGRFCLLNTGCTIDHDNVVTNHVIGVSGELAIEASALPNSQDCSGLRGSRKGLSRGSGCPLDRNLRFCPAIDGPSSREEPSDGGTMRARRTAHRGHLD